MSKNVRKMVPGDGLRSLRSTMLFRAVNYELYIKPNRAIMIFGIITMLGCSGYMFYMNRNHKRNSYEAMVKSDNTVVLVRKESKWTD
ncbi:small integral membrane protein 8 [Harpegnathos saltator]|uniref:small integral membrane protein 8 n=1 Tax=Harpegnathos saltator TaxID=610380 RepID=UPI000948F0D0|nr:small integral membrane protein 8 [Harpegnathos saltator]